MIIGIAGVARSGKDTLADKLNELFCSAGVKSKRYSFAYALKKDLDGFLLEKFGISAFTENSSEKTIIRPILISYGQAKRDVSKGTHWIKKVFDEIEFDSPDVAIISDLRFADTECDELHMIKQSGGIIIHVSRKDENGNFVLPCSEDEARNDPKLREACDFRLVWETVEDEKLNEIIHPFFARLIEATGFAYKL